MKTSVTIEIGSNQATFRAYGQTNKIVAAIIGKEFRDGKDYIYMDRRVHRDDGLEKWKDSDNNWEILGGYSTYLKSIN